MQKKSLILGVLGLFILCAGAADAQMMGDKEGMMPEYARQNREAMMHPENEPYMMYPEMMGAYGPGNCIMGGYGMPGMMMNGYGTGPGMMGGGYGMGPGRHGGMMNGYGRGPVSMMGFASPEKYNDFLESTKELRRKMHSLRFEYSEMMRNPATTMGDLQKKEREMFDLQQQILEKAK